MDPELQARQEYGSIHQTNEWLKEQCCWALKDPIRNRHILLELKARHQQLIRDIDRMLD